MAVKNDNCDPADLLEWTFEQIENRKLHAMIERALCQGIVGDLDVEKIASVPAALKKRGFEMREEGKRLTGHRRLPPFRSGSLGEHGWNAVFRVVSPA